MTTHQAKTQAIAYPFLQLFAATYNANIEAWTGCARMATIPFSIMKGYVRELEGKPIPQTRFDIHSTLIGNKSIPVDVKCTEISKTCDVWELRCRPDGITRHTISLSMPVSGSSASLLIPVVERFLPYVDVSVSVWTAPQNLPRNQRFDFDDNVDDHVKAMIFNSDRCQAGWTGFTISQSGIPFGIALALVQSNPARYPNVSPDRWVSAGTPWDARAGSRPALMNALPSSIIISVGAHYRSAGREIVPGDYLEACYKAICPDDSLGDTYEPQALTANFAQQMYQRIFRKNSIYNNTYLHENQKVDFTTVTTPLLLLMGRSDVFVEPQATMAAKEIFCRAPVTIVPSFPNAKHGDLIKEGPTMHLLVEEVLNYMGIEMKKAALVHRHKRDHELIALQA